MDVSEKLIILADAAKYDVSCSSSGHQRNNPGKALGTAAAAGICHSWSDDGRCISLLKVLYTNKCVYNCAYCVNRATNDVPRAEFTPDEVVKLTINFYRRNYIEGLFLSSGIVKSADHTMMQLIEVVKRLRRDEGFNGYIHLKGIPGASADLIREAGRYVDRMSHNIELPTTQGLRLLAPEKERQSIIQPMQLVKSEIESYKSLKKTFKATPEFVPAGQSTQMIIGATDETDYHILKITEAMYQRMSLKRVYYSAFIPGSTHPAVVNRVKPPLNREHRIYQADWLLRFYGFKADEILTPNDPHLDLALDPKCQWALRHMALFPMEVNRVPFHALLRIPGIGNITARRIVNARRFGKLSFEDLKALGVVLKRAKYFVTCNGQYWGEGDLTEIKLRQLLLEPPKPEQMSLFETHPEIFRSGKEAIRGLLT